MCLLRACKDEGVKCNGCATCEEVELHHGSGIGAGLW